MGNRLSKIITRTGDDGQTHLGDGIRLFKDNARIEALGTLDELNSIIGIVLAYEPAIQTIDQALRQVQQDLFDLGGELCPPHRIAIKADTVTRLDIWSENWNNELPALKEFILPGGHLKSATCHLARTICRRAERCIVKLHKEEKINPDILRYINRLSDLLFIAARIIARETASNEVLWEHKRK